MGFAWYDVVEHNQIEQRDLLFDIDVPVVNETVNDDPPVNVETYDVIVMTQSCDIPKASCNHLILCPVWPLHMASQFHGHFKTPKGKDDLRQGLVVAWHLLNRCDIPGFERDFMVVEFQHVITRPKASVQEVVSKLGRRLRLLPPYREHLAQAFARSFMRVGLPIDIPPFA